MYSTVDDIKADLTETTLMEMTDDSDEPIAVLDSLVEEKISESDALIDSYVKGVATLPITDTSDLKILKKISVSLTVCEIWRRRTQTAYPESVALRYAETMSLLKQIASGAMKLNTEIPTDSSVVINLSYTKKSPKFGRNYF